MLQIFSFIIFIDVRTKTKMQNSACFLLFMLESNVAITVYNWEKQVFPLLTCFVKLPDSIYLKSALQSNILKILHLKKRLVNQWQQVNVSGE